MTSPIAHNPEESSRESVSLVTDAPADNSSHSGDVAQPLEEIRAQLAEWARELDAESTPEPSTCDDPCLSANSEVGAPVAGVDAYIDFLTELSHDELLDVAIGLQAERDTLFRQLGCMPDLSQLESMRERFQQAIEEIKLLRERNEELEAAVAEDRGHAGTSVDQGVDDSDESADFESDWENQKSQWLHRLQNGQDALPVSPRPPANATDHAEIVRHRQLVRQLKEQVVDLRKQLDERTALEALLDSDDAIREERRRLSQLQLEWEAKIRQAELQLSTERAEITRKRKQLDERESTVEALRERLERQQAAQDKSGNWRFLGLGK